MMHSNLSSVGVAGLVSLEYQPWRVVYTYPQQEKKILGKLLTLGMNAYLPLQKIVKQWSDRTKQLEVPLFPNYLFVKVPDVYRFRVLAIPGVTRFISFDGRLAEVSDKEMKMIRLLSDSNMAIEKASCAVGDRIRILEGPLQGLEGVLFEEKGSKRLAIHFDAMAQTVSVDVESVSFKKCDARVMESKPRVYGGKNADLQSVTFGVRQ